MKPGITPSLMLRGRKLVFVMVLLKLHDCEDIRYERYFCDWLPFSFLVIDSSAHDIKGKQNQFNSKRTVVGAVVVVHNVLIKSNFELVSSTSQNEYEVWPHEAYWMSSACMHEHARCKQMYISGYGRNYMLDNCACQDLCVAYHSCKWDGMWHGRLSNTRRSFVTSNWPLPCY